MQHSHETRTGLTSRTTNLPALSQIKYGDERPGDATNREALQKLLSFGLVGAGAGATYRSLLGIRDFLDRRKQERPVAPRPALLEVGVPQVVEEEEDPTVRPRAPRLFKTADVDVPPAYQDPSLHSRFKGIADWFLGRETVPIHHKPWFWTAAIGTPLAGAIGGYKGVGAVLDSIHKKDREKELEQAKEQYRKALIEQYSADSPNLKTAADNVSKQLNELHDELEKKGFWDAVTSAYLPFAATLFAASGLGAYNWAKSKSPDERLAKAIKQREHLRWATRPPELYAYSKPVPVRLQAEKAKPIGNPEDADENDETEEGKIKAFKAKTAEIASLYKPQFKS